MRDERGFTLIELIVAATVFTVGLLALLGTNLLVYELLDAGHRANIASFYARERAETLRGIRCSALADGSETRGGVYQLAWNIQSAYGGNARRLLVLVTYAPRRGGVRTDTVETSVLCAQ